jgi:DNA-binding beta-propeller fold protein YncE
VLRRFDPDGWLLEEIGGQAAGFDSPVDLACGPDGRVYVIDYSRDPVRVFDPSGRLIGKLGKAGTPPEGLDDPVDVAVFGPAGQEKILVACDLRKNGLAVLDAGGKEELLKGAEDFPRPKFAIADPEGVAYLADGSGRIERRDAAGKTPWPKPFGAVADLECCSGRVYVLDAGERAVLCCDPDGAPLARTAALPEDFTEPADLAVSSYELLYVFDADACAVLKFRAKR